MPEGLYMSSIESNEGKAPSVEKILANPQLPEDIEKNDIDRTPPSKNTRDTSQWAISAVMTLVMVGESNTYNITLYEYDWLIGA